MLSSGGTQGKDRKVCVFSYQILLAQSISIPLRIVAPFTAVNWHLFSQSSHLISCLFLSSLAPRWGTRDYGPFLNEEMEFSLWRRISKQWERVSGSSYLRTVFWAQKYQSFIFLQLPFRFFHSPYYFLYFLHILPEITFVILFINSKKKKLKRRIHLKYSLSVAWGLLLWKDHWI